MRREHRPEDFLARDAHVRLHTVEHRGLDVAAATVASHLRTTQRKARAVCAPGLDVAQHALHLLRIDNGAQSCRGIQRIARRQFPPDLRDLLQHARP